MSDDVLLKLEEVAILVGVSFKTINTWYYWARKNPDNEYAKMLPEYIQAGKRQKRFWRKSDLWKFIQFKQSIPKGRNGIMGDVTQVYYHRGKKENMNEQN